MERDVRHFIFGLLVALAPSAGLAGQIYKCTMKAESRNGWISDPLFFETHGEAAYVDVYDYFTKEVYDGSVRARITSRSDRSVRFAWDIEGIELSNRRLKVTASFTGNFNPKTGKLRVGVFLAGMDMDPPRGSGKCEPYKKK